jgi:PRELI-like family
MTGGDGVSYVREISEVDPKSKSVVLKSVNLTWSNILRVNETCSYTPSPMKPTETVFRSSSKIRAFACFRHISNKLENWTVDTIQSNAKLGKEGFESVLAVTQTAFRQPETPAMMS